MNVSERGIPLLWQGNDTVPVVTVENTEGEWQWLYAVHPDGRVALISEKLIQKLVNDEPQLALDPPYHPALIILVASMIGGRHHKLAVDAATGRQIMSAIGVIPPPPSLNKMN